VRFANLMINDMTYLLDESLSKLAQIHALQAEMAAAGWAARPRAERAEREKALRELERSASGYCELGLSTAALLRLFTAEPAAGAKFVAPELAPRLAAMLDYNLAALVGPRCADLIVADKDKYRWDPRALLKEILHIFLNLAGTDAFVRAVAEDGRSYRRELFARAVDISRRRGIGLGEDELARLGKFADEVEVMKLVIDADEDMGEIPDEFTGARRDRVDRTGHCSHAHQTLLWRRSCATPSSSRRPARSWTAGRSSRTCSPRRATRSTASRSRSRRSSPVRALPFDVEWGLIITTRNRRRTQSQDRRLRRGKARSEAGSCHGRCACER
jgi:hypothetical protein